MSVRVREYTFKEITYLWNNTIISNLLRIEAMGALSAPYSETYQLINHYLTSPIMQKFDYNKPNYG